MEKKYLINSAWLISYKIIIATFNLIFNIIIARLYHGNIFGIISYGLSLVSILTIFTSLGMNSILVDEFSKAPNEKEKIFITCFYLKLIVSIILIILSIIFIFYFTKFNLFLKKIIFLQLFTLIAQTLDILDFWLISISKSKINVRNTFISQIIFIVFKLLSLLYFKSIEFFIIFNILQTFFIGVLNFLYFSKFKKSPYKFSSLIAKNILKRSYHLILTEFTIILYTQLDKIMIGEILSVKEVAFYTVAASLSNTWGFILLALANSYSPKIFSLKKEKKEKEYKKLLSNLYSILLCLALLFSIFMILFASPIIKILYGKEYIYSIKLLRILSLSNLFSIFGSIRGCTWMIAENKQKYSKYFCLFGALVNITLNYILILKLNSYGAALSTLLTEIIVTVISPLVFKETRAFVVLLYKALLDIPKILKEIFFKSKAYLKKY